MVVISDAWLRSRRVRQVFETFTGADFEIFVVGGAVRNALLGVPVADVDFATDATPDQMLALAGKAGLKAIPTGIEHGTITLVIDGVGFEITTYRTDIETDGRHAKVAFSDNMIDDAKRRDFTINALYCNAGGEVIDPVNGLADIAAGRVRFVGDPEQRIAEDFLRILRFFRFHAWYGNSDEGLDADGLAACAALSEGLETLSAERVGAEMTRLLAALNPAPTLAAMSQSGVLARILPGADAAMIGPLVHFEESLSEPPVWQRRLAVLGGEDVVDRLRLSSADTRRFEAIRREIGSVTTLDTLAFQVDAELAVDVALARSASLLVAPPDDVRTRARFAAAQMLPVKASDLDPDLKGRAIGQKLHEIEERWVASGFSLTKEQLLS